MDRDKPICTNCSGNGTIIGGGWVTKECEECNGSGNRPFDEDDISYLEIKKHESYNEAIDKIKQLDPSMSDEKADGIFQEEFNKIRKRGRPRKC